MAPTALEFPNKGVYLPNWVSRFGHILNLGRQFQKVLPYLGNPLFFRKGIETADGGCQLERYVPCFLFH